MGIIHTENKFKNIGKRIAGTVAIPVLVAALLLIICAANGRQMISSVAGFTYFLDYAAVITITTLALSINLNSGRFDFSLGSMAVLSCMVSEKIVIALCIGEGTTSAIVVLFLCVVIGLAVGALSGMFYVLLRIPPIITSLGVTLVYEGITYTLSSGKPVTVMNLYNFMNKNWIFAVVIMIVVLTIIIYIFDFSKFGFTYKALQVGQHVSVNVGTKEVPNAVLCYMICGGLMGVVGFLNGGISGGLDGRSLSFASIGIMFNAFLPMFIGGFIGRYSNDKFGYLLAGLTMSMINSTFSVFSNEVTYSTQSIINAVLLVLFLIYLNNEQLIRDIVTLRFLRNKISAKKAKSN